MNEQIEKISEQARQYADSMYPSGLDIAKWGPAYQEKFAELIVRECVDIINYRADTCGDRLDSIKANEAVREGQRECAKTIKEHFGVEE
jgi:hypothetical protein